MAEEDLCRRAFKVHGINTQLVIAMEELAELTVAISHLMRGRPGARGHVAEELADVELVCESIRALLEDLEVQGLNEIKQAKWERFRDRVLLAEARARERPEDRDDK